MKLIFICKRKKRAAENYNDKNIKILTLNLYVFSLFFSKYFSSFYYIFRECLTQGRLHDQYFRSGKEKMCRRIELK